VWSRLPKSGAIADACGRALRRSLPAVAAVAALGVLGSGGWASYRWLTTSPRFAITAITIQGTHHVAQGDLRARLPIHAGDNVFADLADLTRTVRANPWVATAEVHRILPHTIAIEIREHTAAAIVELGELGELYLADASGHPFKRAELPAGEGEGLPIITGIERPAYAANPEAAAATVRAAIAAWASWQAPARPAIGEVHVDPHGAMTLHTYDPVIAIQLGAIGPPGEPGAPASAFGARLHTFDAAWAGLSDAERARARSIHLDARPDHVTVAFAKD